MIALPTIDLHVCFLCFPIVNSMFLIPFQWFKAVFRSIFTLGIDYNTQISQNARKSYKIIKNHQKSSKSDPFWPDLGPEKFEKIEIWKKISKLLKTFKKTIFTEEKKILWMNDLFSLPKSAFLLQPLFTSEIYIWVSPEKWCMIWGV